MVETDRVIHRRYLLQRMLKQGQVCTVYQGYDQILQRMVAIKVVPAAHMTAYRVAIRQTAQFSHPNIVGVYDLIVEPEVLYIVEEYVDGDDFATMLQGQITPYQAADIGMQLCYALIYAGASTRKVCHGDITPAAVMRDRRGQIRLNNFALPSDLYYFTNWSVVGNDGVILSDRELPWGQQTDGRRSDDVRAIGILLYQLLSGRTPGANSVDPPVDGRLRFMRNVPAELCEIVARAIVRQHPQHIPSAEQLYAELKTVADALEPQTPAPPISSSLYPQDEPPRSPIAEPAVPTRRTGNLATAREFAQSEVAVPTAYQPDYPVAGAEPAPAAPTVADISLKLAAARQAAYPQPAYSQTVTPATSRLNWPVLILIALLVFAAFFGVGYFIATIVFHH